MGLLIGRVVVMMLEITFSELLIVDESPLKNVVKKVNVVYIVLISKSSDSNEGAMVAMGSGIWTDLDGLMCVTAGVTASAFRVSVATRLFVISNVVYRVLSFDVYGMVWVVVVK